MKESKWLDEDDDYDADDDIDIVKKSIVMGQDYNDSATNHAFIRSKYDHDKGITETRERRVYKYYGLCNPAYFEYVGRPPLPLDGSSLCEDCERRLAEIAAFRVSP